jgi:hypothetical protein
MATLEDLKDVLGSMQNSMTSQSNILNQMLDLQKKDYESKKRKEERERADRTTPSPTSIPPRTEERIRSAEFREGSVFGEAFVAALLGTSGGIASLIGVLTAGAASVAAVAAGLRGWEVPVIRRISGFVSSFTDDVMRGVTNLRDSLLVRYFGFTASNVPGRDPTTGRFVRGPTVSEQITQRIENLRNSALRIFGLGPDGRPLTITKIDGTEGRSIVGRITRAVTWLLSPLRAVADGVMGFANGAGKALFEFFEPFVKTAGSFASLVGKILKPLGFIFSAWEGVTAFMETEGTVFERLTAGIGAFFGDFIGAPFDLMKNAVAWIIGRLFGIESTDGVYDDSTVTGRVLNMVREFSFENLIDQVVQAPFRFVGAVWDWIGALFTNPVQALTDLWNGYVGAYGTIAGLIWSGIEGAINWVVNRFIWSSENENEQFDLSNFITSKWAQVSTYFSQKFTEFADYIAGIPERISLFAQNMWNNISEELQLGFLDLADWLESIPKKMLAMVLNILSAVEFQVPDWVPIIGGNVLRLVDEEYVRAANAAVNEVDPERESRRAAISESAAAERARIETAMSAIESRALSAGGNTSVVYAPTTVSPVTQVNRGGDSQVQMNAFGGGGRSDLDAMARPGGVQ